MSRNAERACIEAVNEREDQRDTERMERAMVESTPQTDQLETLRWISTKTDWPEYGKPVLMFHTNDIVSLEFGMNRDGKEWQSVETGLVCEAPSHWAEVKGPQ